MDSNLFVQAWGSHNWSIVTAIVILALVRFAKTPIAWSVWQKVPTQYRPWIPVLLGVLSGAGEALVEGKPWIPSVLFGLLAGLATIGIDQAVSKPWNFFTAKADAKADEKATLSNYEKVAVLTEADKETPKE